MIRAAVFVGLAVAAVLAARRSHAAYQPAPFYAPQADPARRMQENVYYPDAPAPVYFPDDNLYVYPPSPWDEYQPDDNLYVYPPSPQDQYQPDDNLYVYPPAPQSAVDAPSIRPVTFEVRPMDDAANLAAFLKMIRVVESQDNYGALVGGGTFNDFSDHPARSMGWKGWRGSRAAGAYQIQPGTMREAINQAKRKGIVIPDFSPQSQDLMAIEILQFPWRQGAYNDVLAGRVHTAMQKLTLEWEAFERMLAGNYPITTEQARTIYANAGGGFSEQIA